MNQKYFERNNIFSRKNGDSFSKSIHVLQLFFILFFILDICSFGFLFKPSYPQLNTVFGSSVGYKSDSKPFHVYCPNLYNGESQMLAIKLAAMNDFVDYFIISVCNVSLSRKTNPRPTYSPMEEEIAKFASKITYFDQNYPSSIFTNSWRVLRYQYDRLMDFIEERFHPDPDDLFIESDVDEIIYPSTMKYIVENPPKTFYKLDCHMFYYSFRWIKNEDWPVVAVFRYGKSSHDLYSYRKKSIKTNLLQNFTCAHCSGCFTSIYKLLNKMGTGAHTNFDKYPFTTTEYLAAQVKCGNCVYSGKKLRYNENLPDFDLTNPKYDFLKQAFPYEAELQDPNIINPEKYNDFYNNCSKGISLI